jgi:adenine-specific DNA-methyltransferase
MPIQKLTPDYTFTEDRLEDLKQVVPEAFADGKINWDVLRETLGEHLEEESQEHFGLFWPGKSEARRLAAQPSKGTLAPCPGEGINEDSTDNIFIEGENLEVLKILLKSYAGEIKMIYIDPPYNTGNDFIYNDNFTEPLDVYLREEGAIGEEGELLTTNTRADGRFHSKWLNMLYPRLILARQFLRDDGVIFVSIDDNEVHNLRHIMNEIFGEENFISQVVWQRAYSPVNLKHHFSQNHDHLLVYAKKISMTEDFLLPRTEKANERYSNPDNDPRGDWKSSGLDVGPPIEKNIYPIKTPSGRVVLPPNGYSWRYSKEKFEHEVNDNRIWFGEDGANVPSIKRFLSEVKDGITPMTIWTYEEVGHTQDARQETKKLFDDKAVFDYPKPVKYIRRMLDIGANKPDSIIMDFFAGSATTAQAVLEKNVDDNLNLSFIMIQLPEKADIEEYQTIADIGKERIRRALNNIKSKYDIQVSATDNFESTYDLGFSVYELMDSNMKQWSDLNVEEPQATLDIFKEFSDPLLPGWEPQDLITEIILIEGFPLTSDITHIENIDSNKIYHISASEFCDHDLFICLDEKIEENTLNLLSLGDQDIFICLDSALSDELKVRLEDQFNIHII